MREKVEYLVIMDMDGTITPGNSWRDLHKYFGTLEKAKRNMEFFLNGKISFEQWVQLDIALWKEPSFEEVRKVLTTYEVRKGFEKFCKTFRKKGVLAIVSCGIDVRAHDIARKYGITEVFANSLVVNNGRVVGGKPIVNIYQKGKFVRFLKKKYLPEVVICIGDTEYDREMLENGDIKIAVGNEINCGEIIAEDFEEILKNLGKIL